MSHPSKHSLGITFSLIRVKTLSAGSQVLAQEVEPTAVQILTYDFLLPQDAGTYSP